MRSSILLILTSLAICGCQDDRRTSYIGPDLQKVSFSTEAKEPASESQEKKTPQVWLDQDAAEFANDILSDEKNPLDEVYVLKWSGYPNCKLEGQIDLLNKESLAPEPLDFGTIGKILKLEEDESLVEFSGWMVITRRRLKDGKQPDGSGSLHEIRFRYRVKTSQRSKVDGQLAHSGISSGEMVRVLKIDPPGHPKDSSSNELVNQLLIGPCFYSGVGNGTLTLSASPSVEQETEAKPWLHFKITPIDRVK